MRARSWALARSGSQRVIVAVLAAVTATTAFLLAALIGYNEHAQSVGIREYLAAMDADAGSVQIQAANAGDTAGRQQAANGLFARHFSGLPLTVYRSVTLPPTTVAVPEPPAGNGDASTATLRPAYFDDLAEHAHLVAGDWPDFTAARTDAGPSPVALEDRAARALGVGVGDTVTTGAVTAVIRAVWAPRSAADPFFAADAAGARTASALIADRAALGFMVVGEDVLTSGSATPWVNWTVVPTRDRVLPEDLNAMTAALTDLSSAVTATPAMAPGGFVMAGGLAHTLEVVTASVVAAGAVGAVPELTIAVIGLVVLAQLARLLALQRRAETALVRSRGASVSRLVQVAGVEAGLIVVPATAVAIGGALLASASMHFPLLAAGYLAAVLTGVVAAVVIIIPAAHQARLPANRQLIDDSGRIRTAVASGTVLLLGAIAAIAWWRFEQQGSAVIIGRDGLPRLDPIGTIAPPAVLVAAAVSGWAVFAGLAGLSEWMTRRNRGPAAWFVSRDIARRATVFGIIVVLTSLAFGSLGLATVYAPTQRGAQQQVNVLLNGAPIRVDEPAADPLRPGEYRSPRARAVAAMVKSNAVVPAVQRSVSIGDADVLLTGVPLGSAAGNHVLPVIPGSFDPAAMAPALDDAAAGLAIPAGATTLRLGLTLGMAWNRPTATTTIGGAQHGSPSPSASLRVDVTLWVQDADGVVSPVACTNVPPIPVNAHAPVVPVPATVNASIDGLAAGSNVIAVDVAVPHVPYPTDVALTLTRLDADSAAVDLGSVTWRAAPQPRSADASAGLDLTATGSALSGTIPAGQSTIIRLTATGTDPAPVAVNPPLRDALDLHIGDHVQVDLDGSRSLPARIAVISPLLPGRADEPAMLADLATLQQALVAHVQYLPPVTQVWAAAGDQHRAEVLRNELPPTATVTAANTLSIGALADPAAVTLWIGAAGALLLAAGGSASVITGLGRSRRAEAVTLRASGIPVSRQLRWHLAGMGLTFGVASVMGLAVAAAGILLTGRTLAGSAVVGLSGATPELHFDVGIAAVLVGAHVVLTTSIALLAGRRTRHAARRSIPSELVT